MRVSKSQICWIRERPHHRASAQLAALSEHGCGAIFDASNPNARDEMLASIRRGDVVKVRHVHLLAIPKKRTDDQPRRDLWRIIHAIEDRGATILEISTGRSSANQRERDMMIADAIEVIARGVRALPRKIAQQNGKLGGRPKARIKPEQSEAARELWFDSPDVVGKHLRQCLRRVGYSLARCYREFGPRGGRD